LGYGAADARARTARVLDECGVAEHRRLKLRQLSKGLVQRVGLAQALLNDPVVIFLDEPMSGLDPLGRRQVRDLILRLRQRGCTVFFSSHILSDAETLCSRVGIMAQGRLIASGRIGDMLAFELKGWELVVGDAGEELMERLGPRVRRVTPLAHARYMLELPADSEPERLVAELRGAGASLVSLHPIRETLEDYFVKHVAAAEPRTR
jgi:ABC-2 type transport system ATP-binding protein